MQKIVQFDVFHEFEVTEETIKGFLLDFRPVNAAGEVCEIADLNKIQVDIILERKGREIVMHDGYLENLLIGLYGQTPGFQLNKKKTANGYLVKVDFSPSVIRLTGKDKLRVKFKAQRTSFVGVVLSTSSIEFVTLTGKGETNYVPVVKSHVIGNNEVSFDMNLGNGIVKAVAQTDYTADYLSTEKAKVENVEVRAEGFEKSVNENVLLAENMHYLDMNPDTDVEDLVLFWEKQPLNDVKIKGKLSKPADTDARVITLGFIRG